MRWYWQLYSLLILSGSVVQLLRKILTDTGGPASRYTALIIAVMIVIGLVAQSRQKALGPRWLWQTFFALLSSGAATLLLFAVYLLVIGVFYSAALLSLAALALLPALVKLHQYSFRSAALWN